MLKGWLRLTRKLNSRIKTCSFNLIQTLKRYNTKVKINSFVKRNQAKNLPNQKDQPNNLLKTQDKKLQEFKNSKKLTNWEDRSRSLKLIKPLREN